MGLDLDLRHRPVTLGLMLQICFNHHLPHCCASFLSLRYFLTQKWHKTLIHPSVDPSRKPRAALEFYDKLIKHGRAWALSDTSPVSPVVRQSVVFMFMQKWRKTLSIHPSIHQGRCKFTSSSSDIPINHRCVWAVNDTCPVGPVVSVAFMFPHTLDTVALFINSTTLDATCVVGCWGRELI